MSGDKNGGIDYAADLVSPLAVRVAGDSETAAEARSEMKNMADQLKRFMDASGLTTYALSKQSGVNIDSLYRFRSGERDLTFQAASKVAEALGLELVQRNAGKPAGRPAAARGATAVKAKGKAAKKTTKQVPPR